MTERDRLAADLTQTFRDLGTRSDPTAKGDGWPAYQEHRDEAVVLLVNEVADRLIDLGWTRVPNPPVMVTDPGAAQMAEWLAAWERSEGQGSNSIQAADLRGLVIDPAWAEGHRRGDALDEERLARALNAGLASLDAMLEYTTAMGGPSRDELAAAIAKAYREDSDAEH